MNGLASGFEDGAAEAAANAVIGFGVPEAFRQERLSELLAKGGKAVNAERLKAEG